MTKTTPSGVISSTFLALMLPFQSLQGFILEDQKRRAFARAIELSLMQNN